MDSPALRVVGVTGFAQEADGVDCTDSVLSWSMSFPVASVCPGHTLSLVTEGSALLHSTLGPGEEVLNLSLTSLCLSEGLGAREAPPLYVVFFP